MRSLGGFPGLQQNEDGTGLRAKSSAVMVRYQTKLSRENLLGLAALASGTADVNIPYAGIGYVRSTRDSYKEKPDSGGIDDAFDYASYGQQSTIGSLGLAYERDNHAGFTLRGGAALTYVLSSQSQRHQQRSRSRDGRREAGL